MCFAPTTLPLTLAAFALGSSSIQVYQSRNPYYLWFQTLTLNRLGLVYRDIQN